MIEEHHIITNYFKITHTSYLVVIAQNIIEYES